MELTALQIVWFILIAVLWIGYLTLEGFDFGVGMLLPILGKGRDARDTEKRKRVMLNTIGPVWDGNEVWVLTAGGATFAAFPQWYATLFSGFYLALALILVALILRGMGLDYRHKVDSDTWRQRWDWAITGGSGLAALLWGVGLTNIVYGTPIRMNPAVKGDYLFDGNLFTLLGIVPLIGGLTFVGLFLTHGAFFIALKTDGEIRSDARSFGVKSGLVTAVLAVVLLLAINLKHGSLVSWVATVVAAVALLGGILMATKGREGWAFIGTFACIAFAVVAYFGALYPNAMPTSLADGASLSLAAASSTPKTLTIMTWAAVVFTPVVLAYQAWTYWVFRKRLAVHHIPDPEPVAVVK
ncbi:MAG TPA: cytochrome d ubiquinol oxidase subunit II [Dermatophilaceae bacterium]|nr:cytochrome d ubiquinol oxidase subunit II [Dermatophilaceae bacterium]